MSIRPAHGAPVALSVIAAGVGASEPRSNTSAVTGVSLDSRTIQPGDLYAALPGAHVHGAQFAAQARDRGAVAILSDPAGLDLISQAGIDLPVLRVPDPRAVLGAASALIYATARGGLCTVREAAKKFGINLKTSRVAVHGFGNVGYHAAYLAKKMFGCKVVAVSDSKGAIFSADGLDPEDVSGHKHSTGSVLNYPGAKTLTNKELLELDVEILIPASLENVITKENAGKVKARILAEMANGPTTVEGEAILNSKGVHIIPDILCNGGGVIVSYFEMVQNYSGMQWEEDDVRSRLERKMKEAYDSVYNFASKNNVTMRQAAYSLAVGRVVEAMQLRGWI